MTKKTSRNEGVSSKQRIQTYSILTRKEIGGGSNGGTASAFLSFQ